MLASLNQTEQNDKTDAMKHESKYTYSHIYTNTTISTQLGLDMSIFAALVVTS